MFAYNPTVDDMSGQIRGQGMMGAAQTRADAGVKMVDDIGGALVGLAGAFGDAGQLASQGDSAYEALGAIGEMYPGMKGVYTSLGKMDPRTRRLAAVSITQNLGAVSQLGIAGMGNDTRQQGLQAQRDRPFIDASLKNLSNTAAGNVPYGGGMAPVEPVLPTEDSTDAAPAGGSVGPAVRAMTNADYQRYRQDVLRRTGRDPGPR